MSISATYGTPAIESIVVLEGEYEAAQERRAAEKWRADEADRRVSLLLQRLARISEIGQKMLSGEATPEEITEITRPE